MLKSRFCALWAGAAVAIVSTVPAAPSAADTCAPSTTCATTVTFTVIADDGLEITVPDGPVAIGSGPPGTQISGPLGAVTVSDERAALSATWTATVWGTAFTTGGGTGSETVPTTAVSYWSGPATATTGTGTFVPGQPDAADAEVLDVPYTAFSKTTGSGDNSATWDPTIVIDIPAQAVAGTYTGTISHSVA
ncbi:MULTISPECIES: hypothetical protein [Streptosporangium]|uniref:WxL domain-containing protein n=1 Tax=Streptosporangium brasiliense TaxID=47480 RepID=A0ABT9RLC0_9ACTN|nr:hypothetical protein [Streptosporangium brasiliense]MDP9869524.1 hypothetical protein [Streptosporangium brasiliense]